MLNCKRMLTQILNNSSILRIVLSLPHLEYHILLRSYFLALSDGIWQLEVLGRDNPTILIHRVAIHQWRFKVWIDRASLHVLARFECCYVIVKRLGCLDLLMAVVVVLELLSIHVSLVILSIHLLKCVCKLVYIIWVLIAVLEPVVKIVTEFLENVHVVGHLTLLQNVTRVRMVHLTALLVVFALLYIYWPAILLVYFFIAIILLVRFLQAIGILRIVVRSAQLVVVVR